jgi:hypothetical protein
MADRSGDHLATHPEANLMVWEITPWVATAAVGWLAWLGKRHVRRIDEGEQRLADLEREMATLATKADLDTIRSHVDERIESLRRDMSANHNTLISYLMRSAER